MDELILKKENFDLEITELINKSGLPAFIIRQTLKDCLEQVVLLEQRQFDKAKSSQEGKNETSTEEME